MYVFTTYVPVGLASHELPGWRMDVGEHRQQGQINDDSGNQGNDSNSHRSSKHNNKRAKETRETHRDVDIEVLEGCESYQRSSGVVAHGIHDLVVGSSRDAMYHAIYEFHGRQQRMSRAQQLTARARDLPQYSGGMEGSLRYLYTKVGYNHDFVGMPRPLS